MVALLLDGITKHYREDAAVDGVTLRVEQGEAVALLGPSGSGKTTILRLVAGLETPTSGDVLFDGKLMRNVPTAQRDLAMVFQDNVLFPTMDVRGNVSFPLEVRRIPSHEIARRVMAESRAIGIAELMDRDPRRLSAGQQQLVQIARAMVHSPGLFLIDEPFGRLDPAQTRALRAELHLLQQGYGVTALYAVHDYQDAMALADRMVLLDAGRVRQVGTPPEIYEDPADTFVATFVGSPPMSLLDASGHGHEIRLGELVLWTSTDKPDRVMVGVRPEAWAIGEDGLAGTVSRRVHLGSDMYITAETAAGGVTARVNLDVPEVGAKIRLRPTRFHVFDAATGRAIPR